MVNVWGYVNVRMSGVDEYVGCPCCGVVLKSLIVLVDHLFDDHSPNEMVGSLTQYAWRDSKSHRFRA